MDIKLVQNAEVHGKVVLLRVDFNVPLKNGKVKDDTRIVQTLPTIEYLLENGAKIILVSHLGRPDGKAVSELRMAPVADYLARLLKRPVQKMSECIGLKVQQAVKKMKEGDMLFLENIRFYPGEEKNSPAFAKDLAKLADLFVSDSFATAHRAHASTVGVAKYLPAYAGFLMQKEIENLSALLKDVKHPLTLITGGAKIDTKIGLLENFLDKADYFLMGGGLANTFLAAAGYDVGESLCEKDKLSVAQDIMLRAENLEKTFVLPTDVIVADEISDSADTVDLPADDVMGDMKILDIGTRTVRKFASIIKKSKTVIWNGPVGLSECKPFSKGTVAIAKALVETKGLKSILGGGDTIDAIKRLGFSEAHFSFVSTGGGAMLEFLEGARLPGVEILLEKKSASKKK